MLLDSLRADEFHAATYMASGFWTFSQPENCPSALSTMTGDLHRRRRPLQHGLPYCKPYGLAQRIKDQTMLLFDGRRAEGISYFLRTLERISQP